MCVFIIFGTITGMTMFKTPHIRAVTPTQLQPLLSYSTCTLVDVCKSVSVLCKGFSKKLRQFLTVGGLKFVE